MAGTGNVRITKGEKESLTVQADENLLEYLTTEVSDSRLILGSRNCYPIHPTKEVTYTIVAKDLNRIALSGSGNITANAFGNSKFSIDLSGSGSITASGSSDSLSGDLSGSGHIDTSELKANSVSISIAGSGTATSWCVKSLSAFISGSGRVEYYGRPELSQSISGSGSVRSLGEK
ncbi:MAG: DUF2807 domain-containing protein [Spirochaetia bacterium]|nr:DUF2807 domain-containing protein [Spirochaetia bacterium]